MVHVVVIGNVYNNKNCRKIYLSNLKILTVTQRGSKGWFTCVFVDSMYHVECPRIPLLHSCLVLVFLKIFLKDILVANCKDTVRPDYSDARTRSNHNQSTIYNIIKNVAKQKHLTPQHIHPIQTSLDSIFSQQITHSRRSNQTFSLQRNL